MKSSCMLAARKRVDVFLYAHLVCQLVFFQLLFDVLLYLLFIASYCIHIVSSRPEMPVPVFVLEVCISIKNH